VIEYDSHYHNSDNTTRIIAEADLPVSGTIVDDPFREFSAIRWNPQKYLIK
jgi:hypothetical protein